MLMRPALLLLTPSLLIGIIVGWTIRKTVVNYARQTDYRFCRLMSVAFMSPWSGTDPYHGSALLGR